MQNPLRLKSIHHVEFWVGNARQAAYFYRHAFGFSQTRLRGPRDRPARPHVVRAARRATSASSSPRRSTPDIPAAEHIALPRRRRPRHRLPGGRCGPAFEEAVRAGPTPAIEPHELRDEHGAVRRAAIHTYGDTLHSFISPRDYRGPFLPGFVERHVAGQRHRPAAHRPHRRQRRARPDERLGRLVPPRCSGFKRFITFDDKDISTEFSALMSIVMSDDSQSIKFPINEPAPGRRKSQIDEYLEYYRGPGVQHIALPGRATSARRCRRCATTAWSSCACPTATTSRCRARGRDRRGDRHGCASWHPGGPRRGGLPAAALHAAGRGSADAVLRDHPAQGQPRVRQGQLQGAVRGDRARAGAAGQPRPCDAAHGRIGGRCELANW